jgi:hypothetical protein
MSVEAGERGKAEPGLRAGNIAGGGHSLGQGVAEGSCQETREEGLGQQANPSHPIGSQMGRKMFRKKGVGKKGDFILSLSQCLCLAR